MIHKKISKKQSKLKTKPLNIHDPFKSKELIDVDLVINTLFECIRDNDLDSFREVLAAYLMTANKMELAKKAGIGRTIYELIDPKKKFNPELSTISAIINAIAA